MSAVCTSSTSIFCFATANSSVLQLKQRSFSLQTAKPAGFRFFLLLSVCWLFYFRREVAPLLTFTGNVSLTLSPIYQSGYMAHFPQVPQTRNSLWLLHSFSTNCVKKQQNPASGNMFPFLVLFCIVTAWLVSQLRIDRHKLQIQIRNSRMFISQGLACLDFFAPRQLYKYMRDKRQIPL